MPEDEQIEVSFEGQQCKQCGKCSGFSTNYESLSCKSCKCFKNFHKPKASPLITLSQVLKDAITVRTEKDSVCNKNGYTWVPRGLTESDEINEFFACFDADDVPRFGTPGEERRVERLMNQIPPHDIDPDFCDSILCQDDRDVFTRFKLETMLKFGVASVSRIECESMCEDCKQNIKPWTLSVIVHIGSQNAFWHPKCFKCRKCSDLLADLAHCRIGFSTYCVRHFNDNVRSRCYTCDEIICQPNFISSMNNHWHVEHLTCWSCDTALAGNKLIMKDERTYCLKCFEEQFCHNCEKCGMRIGADMKDIAYHSKHWHGTCFYCFRCDKSLVGQPFVRYSDSLCCTECYGEYYAARCARCNKVFRAGSKKLANKGKEYHESCFICEFCENPIASSSFLIKEDKVCCKECYDRVFATKCQKCDGVIESSGVVFRDLPFHTDCFLCKQCSCILSKTKFLTHEEHPYCSECYSKNFCKRCFACSSPITGIDGQGKYVNFEDKNWHSNCFVCCKCRMSLANRSFLVEGVDILCPKCAY